MSDIDDLLDRYAKEGVKMEERGTSAGYYSYYGMLASFLMEVRPMLAPGYGDTTPKEEPEPTETLEQLARRLLAQYPPDKWITALREYRIQTNEPLKAAKELFDRLRGIR